MKYFVYSLAVIILLLSGCTEDTEEKEYAIIDGVSKFPDLECFDLAGNKSILSHEKGELLIVNLWTVSCGPCLTEIPELNKLVDEYTGRQDIRFVALTPYGTKIEKLKEVLNSRTFKFEHRRLKREQWIKLDNRVVPTTIICDQQGVIMYYIEGTRRNMHAYIKKIITNLLNGEILAR